MKLKELVKNIKILAWAADPETEITGICYDSRKVEKGDLFVAVKGFTSDGHRFIPKAMELGAAAVLCEDAPEGELPYLRTDDSRQGLAEVSRVFFGDPASEMCMIGITGTSGKTSSSYLLKHLLEETLHAKVGLVGTNGNMIGEEMIHTEYTTPESYELHRLFRTMREKGCTHVVMEVSSHSLALKRVAGIRYNVGLYTNLSQDHLDFHGSMEEYAAAKKLLFSQCDRMCVNLDDEWAPFMMEGEQIPMLRYCATRDDGDLIAKDIRLAPEHVRFAAVSGGEIALTRLAVPGLFSVQNALGVMAVGLFLGIPLADCAEALGTAKGIKGRMELVPTGQPYSVIIDYAHKPDALEKVLKTLRPVTKGRLIALFGCGGDRDRGKRPIMGRIAAENADLVVVTSDNPRTEEPQAIIDQILRGMSESRTPRQVICDRVQAIGWALDNAGPGDVILLAGKGHEDYQIVGHEKHHMDEREIVAYHLKRKQGENL